MVNEFHRGARKYNFRIFMFRERLVNKPLELLDLKRDTARQLQNTMHTHLRDYDLLANSIDVQLKRLSGFMTLIDQFMMNCVTYVEYGKITKTQLASHLEIHEMADVEHRMNNALLDIRARGRELSNMWSKMTNGILDVWKNILNEDSVQEFYGMIFDDVQALEADPTMRDFFLPIFGELMTDKIVFEIIDVPTEDFYMLLNADVPGINLTRKVDTINEMFSRYNSLTNMA